MSLHIARSAFEAKHVLEAAPSPVVVIPVYESYEDVVRCYDAILAHTPVSTWVLVVDDAGQDRRVAEILSNVSSRLRHEVVVLVHDENTGFVGACNEAFAATAGRDVVLVNSDVVVGPEWLDRLKAAATSSSLIATASTLTNHGTILSVPHRNRPMASLPQSLLPDEAARRVASHSARLRPTIPTAVGHCTYIRRAVIDLIGGFDPIFGSGYSEEVDFSQRAVALGFRHVCADDVFTYHRGGGSFGVSDEMRAQQEANEAIIRKRYPWYRPWAERAATDPFSPLADALLNARRALRGLTLGVDARCLGPDFMGTQHVVVETIRALAASPGLGQLVALVPQTLPPYAKVLERANPHVRFLHVASPSDLPGGLELDLVYRPYQLSNLLELDLLRRLSDRVVLNQLDVIAFDNPAYFPTDAAWLDYRDLTRLAMTTADGVAFISEHGREAARSAGLLPPGLPTAVVHCGADAEKESTSAPERPWALDDDGAFILCLGASYLHKNRVFAVDVYRRLLDLGWTGRLVLSGPTPRDGNSLAAEAERTIGDAGLRDGIVTLGSMSSANKRWLVENAALVLYPTISEGFGLVPFEAAAAGVPTLSTRQGSLAEVLPAEIPTIGRFDVDEAADAAWLLLTDDDHAKALVESLRRRADTFTWQETARRLRVFFDEVLHHPRSRTIVIQGEGLEAAGLASRAQRGVGMPARSAHLERFVDFVVHHPTLKDRLSPDGSKRQRAARSVLNRARRMG